MRMWKHLVQNFQEFTGGYPGLVEGNHDVRLVFKGREPFMNYIRKPAEGSLKSNIAGGGSQLTVAMNEIPQELFDISAKVQDRLGIRHNDLYSFDFAYCSKDKRPYLIEINSAPGIWFPDEDIHHRTKFYEDTADFFLKLGS